MRLLASTDMALRVLILLGRQPPSEPMNVETIAKRLGDLSRNHLHKIVQNLATLRILRTLRGAGGGVTVATPLEKVRLGSLIRALEGDHPLVECFRSDGGACVLSTNCALPLFLHNACESFYQSLDRQTLADCLGGARHRRKRSRSGGRLATPSRYSAATTTGAASAASSAGRRTVKR